MYSLSGFQGVNIVNNAALGVAAGHQKKSSKQYSLTNPTNSHFPFPDPFGEEGENQKKPTPHSTSWRNSAVRSDQKSALPQTRSNSQIQQNQENRQISAARPRTTVGVTPLNKALSASSSTTTVTTSNTSSTPLKEDDILTKLKRRYFFSLVEFYNFTCVFLS